MGAYHNGYKGDMFPTTSCYESCNCCHFFIVLLAAIFRNPVIADILYQTSWLLNHFFYIVIMLLL